VGEILQKKSPGRHCQKEKKRSENQGEFMTKRLLNHEKTAKSEGPGKRSGGGGEMQLCVKGYTGDKAGSSGVTKRSKNLGY